MALSRNCGSFGSDEPAKPVSISFLLRTVETHVGPYAFVKACSTTGLRPAASPSSIRPIRSLFVNAMVRPLLESEVRLGRLRGAGRLGTPGEIGPGHDERVVCPRLVGPAFALGDVVHAVGEVASRLSETAETCEQVACRRLAVREEHVNEPLGCLPDG